jgi:hypothetical protein
MQQHRGADTDRIALNGGYERTGGLAEVADEPMRLRLTGGVATGLGTEIGQVIAGRKAVAVPLEQTTRTAGSFSARSSPSDMALYMALLRAFFLSARASVNVMMPASISVFTCSVMIVSLLFLFGPRTSHHFSANGRSSVRKDQAERSCL